jgi:endonuclease/exonuclease/phosphatase family metal-dependent hydrolase
LTFSADRPHERIDCLWVSRNKSLVPLKVWVPQSNAPDHLPVVAEFELR